MKFNDYLLHIISEQEVIGDQVEVPNEEFETREDAEDFIHDLPIDAIVTNDVIDPETGEVLLQAGDSKTAMQRYEKSAERDDLRRQKNIERLKSRYERLQKRGAFLEPEEPEQTPEDKYGMTIDDVAQEFQDMGADMAGDYLYDNPNSDKRDFDSWAQTAAGEAADSQFRFTDPETDKAIKFLKAKYITDVEGWAADEIYEGMRKYARSHGIAL